MKPKSNLPKINRLKTNAIEPWLTAAIHDLEKILSQSRFNEILDQGMHVVIAGKVNVGKSSLFNTLLMKERSIISPLPGTTRDYIQEKLHLDGLPFQITDMAGIHNNTGDDIENQGMRRSLDKIVQADAVIFMVDASRPLEASDHEIYRLIREKKRILLANKNDQAPEGAAENMRRAFPDETVHLISAKDRKTFNRIVDFLKGLGREITEPGTATRSSISGRNSCWENFCETLRQIEHMQVGPARSEADRRRNTPGAPADRRIDRRHQSRGDSSGDFRAILHRQMKIIVIGAGHAGIEAAYAAARMGAETTLLTIHLETLAQMSCNPSIGGIAKGHLVKEIDVLGGIMPRAADATGIHFKVLNRSKGPAVRATRTQNDKIAYRNYLKSFLETVPGLRIYQAIASEIVVANGRVCGVKLMEGETLAADAVIVCRGNLFGRAHLYRRRLIRRRPGQ